MQITILTENVAGGKLLAEHGLSYLVEIDGEQILFDAGHSDVFLRNAQSLGLDVENEVKTVVLSHGHWDHGDGLQFLNNKILITHPNSFVKRYRKTDHSPIGLTLSKEHIEKQFNLKETKIPYQISEKLFFLGEVPRNNNFESQTTPFELDDGDPDFIKDDSALVAVQNNELIIITGCSHSGICNICEYAKEISGINRIKAVIGGFHLKYQNLQTVKTVEYFKENKIESIHPSHCTDLPALTTFYNEFKISQVKTGMKFKF